LPTITVKDFRLTPKLLKGLYYTDQVTVHVVHKAPAEIMEEVEAWNPATSLRNMREEDCGEPMNID